MTFTYGSVCSGLEAATLAAHPLGWRPAFFAEIDPAPCYVLNHHYGSGRPLRMPSPDEDGISHKERRVRMAALKSVSFLPQVISGVPNLGDFTQIQEGDHRPIDLLVGGTPCQDYSVAGLRAGLAGARGNLSLAFGHLAQRKRPRWLVWENVPGVLSSNEGRDFAAILGLLAGRVLGVPKAGWGNSGIIPGYRSAYGLAYRVLDAQYVRVDGHPHAVPQRRRRVVVVGYLGDWRGAAAVLLELACLLGDPPPRRKTGERPAPTISARPQGGGGLGTDHDLDGGLVARAVKAAEKGHRHDPSTDNYVPEIVQQAMSSKWAKGSSGPAGDEFANLIAHNAPVMFQTRGSNLDTGQEVTGTVGSNAASASGGAPCVAYRTNAAGQVDDQGDCAAALTTQTDRASQFVAFTQNSRDEVRAIGGDGEVVGALAAEPGAKQQNYIAISPIPIDMRQASRGGTFTNNRSDDVSSGGAPGTGIGQSGDPSPTIAGSHVPAIAFSCKDSGGDAGEIAPTLRAMEFDGSHANAGGQVAVAFQERGRDGGRNVEVGGDVAYCLTTPGEGGRRQELNIAYNITPSNSNKDYNARESGYAQAVTTSGGAPSARGGDIIATQWKVRRLMPVECERLQAVPDNYTLVPYRNGRPMADGPRYKMLGNSFAVNVFEWVFGRIAMVERMIGGDA